MQKVVNGGGKKSGRTGGCGLTFYWDVGGLFVFEERFDVVRGGDYEALVFCQAAPAAWASQSGRRV